MAKGLTTLADLRRDEQLKSLKELPDRDLCELIRAHFESHPTLPGEKGMKDQVNQLLAQVDAETQKILSQKQVLPDGGFVPAVNTPFDNDSLLTADEKEELARQYAQTRIRETSLKEGNYYLDFHHFDPTELKRDQVDEITPKDKAPIYVDRVNVELQNNGVGDVYVLAELSDGGHRTIGSLPENFLKNNPMNVDSCAAELQIVDYSNGNMKNINAKIVVDTDLMSGDVIDLDDSILAGLDQEQNDDLNQ